MCDQNSYKTHNGECLECPTSMAQTIFRAMSVVFLSIVIYTLSRLKVREKRMQKQSLNYIFLSQIMNYILFLVIQMKLFVDIFSDDNY